MPKRVVIFDTSCLLCSRFIQILLNNDQGNLSYTGFESQFAEQNLDEKLRKSPETVIYYDDGSISVKSQAVLSILKFTRWPYNWLRIFKIFPEGLLNLIYDWIARNRYSWFGRSEACFIPDPQQKARFLD